MCGIRAGIDVNEEKFIEELNLIQHRGPDCTLTKFVDNVALGFQRLSIIGVSEENNVILEQDGVYLVCNGEIYNYTYLIEKYDLKCKTKSDCEVILQLYTVLEPKALLLELDGVFSFFIYDSNIQSCFIARDRIGVRPLFYQSRNNFLVSSESKGLTEPTIFPPGQYFFVSSETCRWSSHTYFDYTFTRHLYDNLLSQKMLHNTLIRAVEKRLISERPIGFLLSGGLDSSLVASIASHLVKGKITTFSIGFEGSPDLIAARKVADYLETDHHEVYLTQDQIVSAVPKVIYHLETYDITTVRASTPMYLLAEYISTKTDIKVIFSGEGADELLGGYLYFHNAPNSSLAQNESVRLMRQLHLFDVLRSDRTTAGHGLELRVPFLDADMINLCIGLDPELKFKDKMEKKILRDAFKNYLPDEVLYRKKEAFSDGVGISSVETLKEYSSKLTKPNLIKLPNEGAIPYTPESKWYYFEYQKHFNGVLQEYWMPKWNDVTDPSATVLKVYQN